MLQRVLLGSSPSRSPPLQTHRQAVSSVVVCRGEVPATPASAMLSIIIDLLQRRSFRKTRFDSAAGRSAHTPREMRSLKLTCSERDTLSRHAAAKGLRAGASGAPAARKEALLVQQQPSEATQDGRTTHSGFGRGRFSQCAGHAAAARGAYAAATPASVVSSSCCSSSARCFRPTMPSQMCSASA